MRPLIVVLGWLLAPVGPAVPAPAPADSQEPKKPTVEIIPYQGWKQALRIGNGDAELIATLEVGPRILSYRLKDGPNVFREFAEQLGKSGEADWVVRGGHRLWTSPEDLTRTYAPDNAPVAWAEPEPGLVRLTPPADAAYGIQKELDIRVDPSGSGVVLVHRIKNIGNAPTDLAIWALSVMAPGGVEIIPLPPKAPHPGSPRNARSPDDFAPNQSLVLWPFTDLADSRLQLGTKYIRLSQSAQHKDPTKIGLDHRQGWVGYLNAGTLFVKRFDRQTGEVYPDRGVNFETFTNADMLEIETLGPLVRLQPGLAIEHTERWELHGQMPAVKDEADIDRLILPKVRGR